MTAVEQTVRMVNGGCFASVDYATPNHGLLKTSKVDGSINPFWSQKDAIRKVVTNCQINLGVIYQNGVNGRLVARDISPDFTAQPMRGKVEHSTPHKNVCMNTDGSKTYIRYMPMLTKKMSVSYELNGQDITEQVKLYRKPRKSTATQEAKGLSQDEQIAWRTLDIANITELRVTLNGAKYKVTG